MVCLCGVCVMYVSKFGVWCVVCVSECGVCVSECDVCGVSVF